MKACPCLAGAAALALALTAAAIPAPAQPAPGPNAAPKTVLPAAPPPHDAVTPYTHTALGAVIEANGWKVPATGAELAAALAKLGDFVQLPVTFSAVALHSGLSHPRVVITMRPSLSGAATQVAPSGGGWGGSFQVAGPLGPTPANRPYLEGRLFLAANTEPGADGQPVIKTVEFISWNSRKQKFDFGVIEGMGGAPEVKFLDGARCFSCHKNRGPILGVAPWSNTAHNDLVRTASAPLFKFAPLRDKDGVEDPKLGTRIDIDGLRVLSPNGPEVDAAVRQGADVLRDRERFRMMVRAGDGRKALVALLGGVATRGDLVAFDRKNKQELAHLDLVAFLRDAHAANKALAPSTLADFSPSGPVNRLPLPKGQNPLNQVTKYDALRAGGSPALPSEHQPSNPRAFVRPPVVAPTHPAQLVSVVALARAIGLSEDDRTFLATALDEAAKKINDPAHTPAALARAVFTGPSFADVLKSGVLPERDDFKDRFVEGLVAVVRARDRADRFWHDRGKYATAPRFDPNAPPEKEMIVLPSHACLGCHDVRTGAKPTAFNPIPLLAFDPFDVTARDAWLKTADRKRKVEVLGRFVKRLGTDKDMPPADSTEHELFRVKDPTALAAVKEWLDAELKKVK